MPSEQDPVGDPTMLNVNGERIAVRHRTAASDAPTIHWLGGWRSDMRGGKALALDALAADRGWGMLRHDYSGHGESSGSIVDGTISAWTEQSLAVLDREASDGPVLLAGSSMGAWIALLIVARLQERGGANRLAGMLLIAPAPDFVTELMLPNLTADERTSLERDGRFLEHSDYSPEPNVWTRAFIADGERNRTMETPLELHCPVHIVQGTDDTEVPLDHARKLFDLMAASDATLTIVRGGDHRLSRPADLSLITRLAENLVKRATEG